MSGVDLAEFRTAYVGEVDELLATSNRQLLLLEAALRRGEQHPGAVRELFRAMHTIKGLSAMVGVEPIVMVAHRLESLLRAASRGRGTLSTDSVDAMLQGVREMETRVRAVAQGRAPAALPPALLARFEGLELGKTAVRPASGLVIDPVLGEKLSEGDHVQLAQGLASGKRVVQLDFAPSIPRAQAGITITTVREGLAAHAEIVKVVPRSMPVTPATPGGLAFSLLLLTAAADAVLAEATRVEAAAFRTVAEAAAPAEEAVALEELAEADDPVTARRGIVRVDVERLDDAMERLSGLIVNRFRLKRAVKALEDAGSEVRGLSEVLQEDARLLRDLRASILRLRMVPMFEVLDRVPLLVRGLSRSTGRQLELEMDLGDTEIDKTVAERIFPAIVHLVRNAVDHAIEPPEERLRLGKRAGGRLRIGCVQRSDTQLEITCRDDGRGIDAAEVARRAGRPLPRSAAELLEVLALPGFSTRDEVTTTSGRGMGMDIVRRTVVDELGGELLLETERGQGTTFFIRVPLTVSIVDAFTFETAGERFCVPVGIVEEILDVDRARLVRGPGAAASAIDLGVLERRGETLPFVALAGVLRRTAGPGTKAFVVRRNGEAIAFAVDRLVGQQAVVVRPLEDPLVRVPGVTGATDLGDGRPTLVLDLHALLGGAS